MFWLVIGLILALVLLAAWRFDRRGKRRGRQVRASANIALDVREQGRGHEAGDAQAYLNPDQSWTYRSRQSKE